MRVPARSSSHRKTAAPLSPPPIACRSLERRGNKGTLYLVAGGLMLAAATYIVAKKRSNERVRQLARGELRTLRSIELTVDNLYCHTLASFGIAPAHRLPLVLVHGFGVSGSYFVPLAERLAPEFDVYVPDLPGHGRNETALHPLDIERFAEFLASWISAMHLPRVCLIGHSMGCQIAVETARRFPEQVARLILIGPAVDPRARTIPRLVPKFLASSVFERPSLYVLLLRNYSGMGRRLACELRAVLAYRIENALPQITAPVLFVSGERDMIAPKRWLDDLAKLAPRARTAVIPRWGHAVHYSAADELARAIMPFLREPLRDAAATAPRLP